MDDKKLALKVFAFIHNKLLTIQFYPEEFDIADKSLKLIEVMAKQLQADLKEGEENVSEEVSINPT